MTKDLTTAIADAITTDRAAHKAGLLLSPYLWNRKLRRAAYKQAALEFKPAIEARASANMKQTGEDFLNALAVKQAMRLKAAG